MMVPLLHHGMIIQGLPYAYPELNQTKSGGTPYGVTHVQGRDQNNAGDLSKEEAKLAEATGKQLAELALKIGAISN
jgi:NAD(P)H dehydrogenase (quinone)